MKFIHIADVHLGAQPDKEYTWSQQRGEELWDSFREIIEKAKKEQAELLLIAGDLFHRQPLKGELKEVNYLFSTIPHTQVVLMVGNHDYMKPDSYYRDFPWNENVTFFKSQELKRVYLKELQTYVYGLSYHSREIIQPCYDDLRPGGEPGNHILLAHGGDKNHIPIQFGRLAAAGFDYVALGHIHKPQILSENKMAYAGALEPIDQNDFGSHGYVEGILSAKGTRIRFCPFAKREYIPLEIQTNEHMPQSLLEAVIRENIEESGKEHTYSISLVGYRDEKLRYNLERVRHLGRIVDVEDYTEPALDIEALRRQYAGTVIGEYIRHFPESPEGTQLAALHYGIQALLQTKR